MTGTIAVETQTLRETANEFATGVPSIAGNRAGPAVSAAAGGFESFAIAAACSEVGGTLSELAEALGRDVTCYADKLREAATRYDAGDAEAAELIDFAGVAEPEAIDPHPPVDEYERALRDAGLLDGPAPDGYYRQWLENASRQGVPPYDIVDIARTHNITPADFEVLDGLEEVKDRDGKSFFILPPGTKADDAKKAVVMTYILNAGTDYADAEGGEVVNDFAEVPYSAGEVQRIIDRQNANSWSYTAASAAGKGGALATTPNGMLMGLGGPVMENVAARGGTAYGDVFVINVDGVQDPATELRKIITTGQRGGLDLDRLLHHEERHSQQWAEKGAVGMGRDYGLGAVIERSTGTNPLERDAGLSDGGYR